MDVNQFLHFLMGSSIGGKLESSLLYANQREKKKREQEISALLATYYSKVNSDLREVITANLPVIYLVDCEVIVKSVINSLLPDVEHIEDRAGILFFQVVKGIKVGGSIKSLIVSPQTQELDEEVLDRYALIYETNIINSTPSLAKEMATALKLEFRKTIAFNDIVEVMKNTLATVQNAAITAASVASLDTDMYGAKVYLDKAEARGIAQAGKDMRAFFTKNTPAQVENPENIINNYKPNTQVLLVGDTFNNLVAKVNKVLSQVLVQFLGKYGIIAASYENKPANKQVKQIVGASIGYFANAGHAAAVSGGEFIGVNTPLIQSTLVNLASINNSSSFSTKEWAQQSGHIDVALDLHKDTRESAKYLISGGLSFVVSMDAVFNSQYLAGSEVTARDQIIKQTLNGQGLKMWADVRRKLFTQEARTKLISLLRFSPTLLESVGERVVRALQPGKSKGKVTSGKGKSDISLGGIKSSKLGSTGSATKMTAKSLLPSVAKRSIRRKSGQFASLLSIQTLLNQALATKIKQSMGTPALNNRTGRFAESVKVENMSQSRQGMITAFYSYMKSPYQTFEPGYAQGSEKRNPKTLISKSIREIAADLVGNRLRAVSI